jgi:hypothetical protein
MREGIATSAPARYALYTARGDGLVPRIGSALLEMWAG